MRAVSLFNCIMLKSYFRFVTMAVVFPIPVWEKIDKKLVYVLRKDKSDYNYTE